MQINRPVGIAVKSLCVAFWVIVALLLAFTLSGVSNWFFLLPALVLYLGIKGYLPNTKVRSDIFTKERKHYIKLAKWSAILVGIPVLILSGIAAYLSSHEAKQGGHFENGTFSNHLPPQLNLSTDDVVSTLGIQMPLKEDGNSNQAFGTKNMVGWNTQDHFQVTFIGPPDNLGYLDVFYSFDKKADENSVIPSLVQKFLNQTVDANASSWIADQINNARHFSLVKMIFRNKEPEVLSKEFSKHTIRVSVWFSDDKTKVFAEIWIDPYVSIHPRAV